MAAGDSQQVISSFFKPSQAPKRPSASEILILSSDDDDGDLPAPSRPTVKKVKVEHEPEALHHAAPVQTAQLSRPASLPPVNASAAPRTAATTKRQPSAKVRRWQYDPSAPTATASGSSSTSSNSALARRLLGRNLLGQRKTSYLQQDHYMAANAEASGSNSPGTPQDSDDELAEEEQEEQEVPIGKGKGKAVAKGKGKSKDQEQDLGLSKFAKYAAKGSSVGKSAASASAGKVKYTPLEQQVIALKKQHPGVVLAVEVGYKYRFFEEDAVTASLILNIACFPSKSMMTASIPTHRINVHLKRLITAGLKVGVVRQAETAALKKASDNRSAPFTRKLAALYTSATFIDELTVEPGENVASRAPTLMCLVEDEKGRDSKVKIGMVAVVPSTGEVIYDEFDDTLMRSELETRMLHLQPSELILQKDLSKQTESIVKFLVGQHDAGVPGFTCRVDRIKKRLKPTDAHSFVSDFLVKGQKEGKSKKGKGKAKTVEKVDLGEMVLDDDDDDMEEGAEANVKPPNTTTSILDLPSLVLVALSSLITHLSSFQLDTVFLHSSAFNHFTSRATMNLNGNTLTNLEILVNSDDGRPQGSLLSILDHTKTAFGRRKLRLWISRPLVSIEAVTDRLDAVDEINSNASASAPTLYKLRELFRGLPDLERGLVRIHFGKASPAELLKVLQAFERVAKVFEPAPEEEDERVPTAKSVLKSKLLRGVVESLPKIRDEVVGYLSAIDWSKAREGKKEEMFKELTEDLQDCRDCLDAVHYELSALLADARKVLKKPAAQFIKVGEEEYLIEVRIAESKKLVPADWVRINSTKAAYRFRPPAVQAKIEELAQCRERIAAAADVAFADFLKLVATSSYESFRLVVSQLSVADVCFSFAETALSPGYTRPTIVSDAGRIEIEQGRHPIIEVTSSQPFVPNSVKLGAGGMKQMILTGLNMGGKTSQSRSVALIALMAQIGCYVPAESCTTSLFDAILTRSGATDEIARGRSTFMVEMTETSEILKMATPRSLVILDELGRGTSTSDGQAIASAVLQHIVSELKATTIFVTHYPSLADLVKRYPESLAVFHMACLETPRSDGMADVTFLYTLQEGLASRSHGLNVARLAELPESVLNKAFLKSKELEHKMTSRLLARRGDRLAAILKMLKQGDEVDKEELLERCLAALH